MAQVYVRILWLVKNLASRISRTGAIKRATGPQESCGLKREQFTSVVPIWSAATCRRFIPVPQPTTERKPKEREQVPALQIRPVFNIDLLNSDMHSGGLLLVNPKRN